MLCFQFPKNAAISDLQDQITSALIGLVRSTDGNEHLISASTDQIIIEGLFNTMTNVNFSEQTLQELLERIDAEKKTLVPGCYECAAPCGRNNAYDMKDLQAASEDIRSLKSLILFGIRELAAHAYHAAMHGDSDAEVNRFFYKALFAIGMDWDREQLLPIVLEVGSYLSRSLSS